MMYRYYRVNLNNQSVKPMLWHSDGLTLSYSF